MNFNSYDWYHQRKLEPITLNSEGFDIFCMNTLGLIIKTNLYTNEMDLKKHPNTLSYLLEGHSNPLIDSI